MPREDRLPQVPAGTGDLPPEIWQHVFRTARVPMFIEDIGAARDLARRTAESVGMDRFRGWLEAHPEFIGRIVQATRVLDVNDAAVRLNAASSRAELLVSLDKLILPESLAAFRELIALMAEGADLYEGECQYRALDGREYHTMNRACLPALDDPNQIMVIATVDITDRRLAERALAASEERYRQLIETANDVILRHDLSGRITFVNRAGVDLLGYPRERLVGLPVAEIAADPEARRVVPQQDAGGVQLYETEFRRQDGSFVPVEVNATLLPGGAAGLGEPQMLLFVRDITVRRSLEEERVQIEARLRDAQRLDGLGVLAGGIAHDFNNLLAIILGNAELIDADDDAARAGRAAILAAGHRAADLCSEMLAYAGRAGEEQRRCDISRVIGEIRGLLRASVSGGSRLGFELAEDLSPVQADPPQLRQLVMGLVANATEAVGDGGGEIIVRTGAGAPQPAAPEIFRVGEALGDGPWVFCEVRDSGMGMDEVTVGRACDPFFSTRAEGRGLGLFAAAGIVRAHGGLLDIDSAPERGTTVTVWLPPGGPVAEPAVEFAAPPVEDLAGRTVLVVDDEPGVRAVVESYVRRLGGNPLSAADGFEAVRLFGLRHAEIDAVVLDYTMPGLDGAATVRRLRVIRPDVPVLISSGRDEPEVHRRIGELHGVRFLAKPFVLPDLALALGQVLP